MKTNLGKQTMLMLAICALTALNVHAATSGELLQQALYAEEIEGDLPAAITGYETIIQNVDAPSNHVAQALYRQGMCYLKLKQDVQAEAALSRLCNEYPGQTELVGKALPVLESIRIFDPAALMPPETLAYLELGSTGNHVETVLEMLKGTPMEDPLSAVLQNNPDALGSGAGPVLAGLLNPAMQEEYKKIRGLAVGLVDVHPNKPELVAVLHLGESTMLRGLLMTGLSMAARTGPAIEGMATYSIEGQFDVAYDNQVFLASFSSDRLPWMVRRYKNLSSDASLASSNQIPASLDRSSRRENLASIWINLDDLYARFSEQVPDLPRELHMQAGMINIQSIDDLTVTASLATKMFGLDGRIRFKEGMQNMMYEIIRTPSITRDGFTGVPEEAGALLSFDLAGSDSMQAAQLRQLALSNLGVDLPAGLIDSIEQVSLFALPGADPAKPDLSFRPGLVIRGTDRVLAESFVEGLQEIIDSLGVNVEVIDGAVIAAMDSGVIGKAKAASAGTGSVTDSGYLHEAVNQYAPTARKLVLVNGSGIIQTIRTNNWYFQSPMISEEQVGRLGAAYERLADQMKNTVFSLRTEESDSELVLSVRLSGIPDFGAVLPTIEAIEETMRQVDEEWRLAELDEEERRRAERLAELVPARIVRTISAPAIDGEREELWEAAPVYHVEKIVSGINEWEQGEPIDGNEFAAEFRMLWDAENLYVFMEVTDSTPNHNPEIGWQFSDNAIFYIDATDAKSGSFGPTDYEYAFSWDAASPTMSEKKHGRMENVVFQILTTETGYCVEAAFPWATLGTPDPKAGTVIGIDVQVSDNQAGPERNQLFGWQDDTNGAWLNPALFGRAELVNVE